MIILRLGLAAEHQSLSWLAQHFTKGGTSKEVAMISKAAQLSEHYRKTRPAGKPSLARRRLVCGVGVNDADYMAVVGKERCQAYMQWCGMIRRCYNESEHEKCPTYAGCSVDSEWHSFMAFRSWWLEHHRDGFELDKDLLVTGNKVYSPMSCVFVPPSINLFLTDCRAARGKWPIGVSLQNPGGRFRARCRDGRGAQVLLGSFSSPSEASLAWQRFKLDRLESMRADMDAIDPRIYVNAKSKIISYSGMQP